MTMAAGVVRSTQDVNARRTLGMDPGWSTGLVVREGVEALYGTTIYTPPPKSLDDCGAIMTGIHRVQDEALEIFNEYGPMLVAVEMLMVAKTYAQLLKLVFASNFEAIPKMLWALRRKGMDLPQLGEFLLPYTLGYVLAGTFRGAILIPAGLNGGAGDKYLRVEGGDPKDFYPPSLIGKSPAHWGVNEHPDRSRRDQRSAWDLAGEANRLEVAA